MTSEPESPAVPGGCACGLVTYEIDMPTVFCGHCHCSMCRKPHGASYVTWAGVPQDQFRITSGAQHLNMYVSSEQGRRQFCAVCGSHLFCWHETEDGSPPKVIDVTVASLQGDIDRHPEVHFFYDSRASWTVVNDDLPKLGGTTGVEPLDEAD